MRFHLKNLSALGLPAFLSLILLTVNSSFGQVEIVPAATPAPHHEPAPPPKAAAARAYAPPEALAEQLKMGKSAPHRARSGRQLALGQ